MSYGDWIHNSRGEWYVIAQAAIMLLVLIAPRLDGTSPSMSAAETLAGAILCLVGLTFVVLGSLSLGRSLSPFPRPRDEGLLVEAGIFSLVRHPIYTGLTVLALGWSTMWMSLAALAATAALFAFFDTKSRREECWLQEKFEGYGRYKTRVKKLVPFIY
ncbi:methyltransferase family protein [Mesorhizobium koreense]|uniref:methyltransferase family protein n=1 Tax=Mesorhizobium koreense TaxID=3074855 RepID=UPI00287B6025|nr:isoprenylcysteine carboxylmethyltransferase family protein [Mesorhizobium sp. WR6]